MYISVLQLNNYRNFEKKSFTFDEDLTAVCADNARGKSNLLEAIFFLAIAKSGRGAKDRDVVRWGQDYFRIDATVHRDKPLSVAVVFDTKLGKKRAFLDDSPLPRLSGLIGAFNAVLFSPEDVDLVLRDPPQRRRLLDILVSQSNAPYLSDLDVYRRVLSQRNRLLKERQGNVRDHVLAWNVQLAEVGARIVRQRHDALDRMTGLTAEYYGSIGRAAERVEPVYRSVVPEDKREAGEEILNRRLEERFEEELGLGYTLSGPHRDNLVFQLDGRAAHQFASKGQLKSVLLAWKLAEATYLERETGTKPVMLMDDIFSELDASRASSLLELVRSFGQVVLTSARDPDLPFRDQGFQMVML